MHSILYYTTILTLIYYTHVCIEDVIAFGDGENDIEMLRLGMCICVVI